MDRLEETVWKSRNFVEERVWRQFHDPMGLAMAIASEAGGWSENTVGFETMSPFPIRAPRSIAEQFLWNLQVPGFPCCYFAIA